MLLPDNKPIYEDDLAFYWMDGEILCSVTKSTPRNTENMIKSFELIDEITVGKKVCLLSDTSATGSRTDEARAISADLVEKQFKAMAMFSSTSFGKLLVNTFITVSGQPLPMQLFSNEEDAREWLKNYV